MKKIYILSILTTIIFPLLTKAEISVAKPTNIKISGDTETAIISWKNPEDAGFSETILFRSNIPIENYFSYEAVDGLCDIIYEGSEETYTDKGLAKNLTYYYILFSRNKSGEYSDATVLEKKGSMEDKENKEVVKENASSLAGASSDVVNEVSFNDAGIIYNFNKTTETEIGSNSRRLALFIIVKSPHDLTTKDKDAISYFIDAGTPTTILLGAGERTGVLNSYLSVFNKLPRSVLEWQDVIKIANGRWPNERNIESEKKASDVFFSAIYKRDPEMNNPNDNAAVTVIAYGLRPAQRNLESESKAIEIYKSIFKKSPAEASDWDLVRAIAYSGAVR